MEADLLEMSQGEEGLVYVAPVQQEDTNTLVGFQIEDPEC